MTTDNRFPAPPHGVHSNDQNSSGPGLIEELVLMFFDHISPDVVKDFFPNLVRGDHARAVRIRDHIKGLINKGDESALATQLALLFFLNAITEKKKENAD